MAAMHHTETQPIGSIQSELDGPIGWVWPSYKLQVMGHQSTQHRPTTAIGPSTDGYSCRRSITCGLYLGPTTQHQPEHHRAINGWLYLVPTHNLWLIAGSDH
jgi:hypothetical protein